MKKLLALLLLTISSVAFAQVKISELPAATALTGTETLPAVQGADTVKTTTGDIRNLPLPATVTGSHTYSGTSTFSGMTIFSITSPIEVRQRTPAQLSTTVNNYNFDSFGCCDGPLYRLEAAGGGSTVTGFALTAGGFYMVYIVNVSTTDTITFKNEDSGSTAGNRFRTPNAADYILRAQGAALLWRDETGTNRWRIIAP